MPAVRAVILVRPIWIYRQLPYAMLALIGVAVLTGCGGSSPGSPLPTPSTTPTPTPATSPNQSPTPTVSPTQSPTPAPTKTALRGLLDMGDISFYKGTPGSLPSTDPSEGYEPAT